MKIFLIIIYLLSIIISFSFSLKGMNQCDLILTRDFFNSKKDTLKIVSIFSHERYIVAEETIFVYFKDNDKLEIVSKINDKENSNKTKLILLNTENAENKLYEYECLLTLGVLENNRPFISGSSATYIIEYNNKIKKFRYRFIHSLIESFIKDEK